MTRRLTFSGAVGASVCGILFSLLPAVRAGAQGSGEPAGEIVIGATKQAYRGRKVVIDFSRLTPQITTLTVLCETGGRERREFPATRGVIVTDGSTAWQYFPERGIVVKRPVRRGDSAEVLRSEQLHQALASYEIRSAPAGLVAGRRSRLLEFYPRQSGSRPLRKVWLDVDTGLVLRTEVYNHENRLSWLSVFEVVEYRPPAEPEAFKLRVPAGVQVVEAAEERCVAPEEAERASGLALGLPQYLPAGFAQTCIRTRRHHAYGEVQVLFSDGLSLLSLFESTHFKEPGGGGGEPANLVGVGPWPGRWYDLGLVTGLAWGAPGMHHALLGELSRGELHKVAVSIRPRVELSGARVINKN